MLFKEYLGKKYPKFFPAGPFFRMLQIKLLSKRPYFQKPPLPWKILGYSPDDNEKTETEEIKIDAGAIIFF